MTKEVLLVPLFEKFIRDTKTGRRCKLNGQMIKPQTVVNYREVLKHLVGFEQYSGQAIRITLNIRNDQRRQLQESNYWKDFYRNLSDYLYYQKGCYDNFTGTIFKNLKCFFRYIKSEKCLAAPDHFKNFHVKKENIRVISLLPEQFYFLVHATAFERRLTRAQKRIKDMFIFGTTGALRYSDLMNLQVKDIECHRDQYFLVFRSVKTDTPVTIKLPGFAVCIFQKYGRNKTPQQKLFPQLANSGFNKQLRQLTAKAGWTQPIGKTRSRNGEPEEVRTFQNKTYRFCDQLSSHAMRKTGITLLLMLGMPEYLVRKISGHSANSTEFFRYVNFAQSFITDEIDKVHQKLLTLYQ
ncbi:MAG: tyrosine-type recombinase/integrase [Chitinophagaceae bacterium]